MAAQEVIREVFVLYSVQVEVETLVGQVVALVIVVVLVPPPTVTWQALVSVSRTQYSDIAESFSLIIKTYRGCRSRACARDSNRGRSAWARAGHLIQKRQHPYRDDSVIGQFTVVVSVLPGPAEVIVLYTVWIEVAPPVVS